MPPKKISASIHTWPADARADPPEPRLLRNRRNFCYSNAVLQCLMHEPAFCSFWLDQLTQHEDDRSPGSTMMSNHSRGNPDCIICALKQLKDKYWKPDSDERDEQQSATDRFHDLERRIATFNRSVKSSLPARNLVRQKGLDPRNTRDQHALTASINSGSQIDAWEFACLLTDLLQYRLTLVDLDNIASARNLGNITNPEKRRRDAVIDRQFSLLQRLFLFNIRRSWECNDCEEDHVTVDIGEFPELGLDINITQPSQGLSLVRYIRNFFDDTVELRCDNCAGPRSARTKKGVEAATKDRELERTIIVAPEILFIRLRRWYGQTKISDEVDFTEELDLSNYADEALFKQGLRYRCQSVVAHRGTFSGGHYVAAIRGVDDKTDAYILDDADDPDRDEPLELYKGAFKTLKQPMVNNEEFLPYVLVYRRIYTKPARGGRGSKATQSTATKTKGSATQTKGKGAAQPSAGSGSKKGAVKGANNSKGKAPAGSKKKQVLEEEGDDESEIEEGEIVEEKPKKRGAKTNAKPQSKAPPPATKNPPGGKSQPTKSGNTGPKSQGEKPAQAGAKTKGKPKGKTPPPEQEPPSPTKTRGSKRSKPDDDTPGDRDPKPGAKKPKTNSTQPAPTQGPRGTKRPADAAAGDEGSKPGAKKAKTTGTETTRPPARYTSPPRGPLTRLRRGRSGNGGAGDGSTALDERGMRAPRRSPVPSQTPSPKKGKGQK